MYIVGECWTQKATCRSWGREAGATFAIGESHQAVE